MDAVRELECCVEAITCHSERQARLSFGRLPDSSATCRNCGELTGPKFCGSCGQAVDDHRAPLVALIREFVEESRALDSRALRTLRALLRPGQLTALYLNGKRAPFLTPFRLYLLASVVLFSSALTLEPPNADTVNFYIGEQLMTGDEPVAGRPIVSFMSPDSVTERWMLATYAENFDRLKAMPPQQALDVLFRGLRSALPVALIAFLPLFALGLKLLYVRRRVLYVDHLMFAAHFQSALFLSFAVAWLVARIAGLGLAWTMVLQFVVFLLMISVYLPMALRRLHGESRAMTAGKTFLVFGAYLIAMQWVVGPAMLFVIARI